MDWKSCYLFVLSVSMFVSISGEETRPHFCEALETNKQIDFTLNVPQKTHFNNYIFINGNFWKVLYTPIVQRRRRDEGDLDPPDDEPGDDPPSAEPPVSEPPGSEPPGSESPGGDDGSTTTGGGGGNSPNGTGGPVKFMDPYGQTFKETTFFAEKFKCAFGIRYRQTPKWTTNVIGGLTADFSKVRYIVANVTNGTVTPGGGDGGGGGGGDGGGGGSGDGGGGGSGDDDGPGDETTTKDPGTGGDGPMRRRKRDDNGTDTEPPSGTPTEKPKDVDIKEFESQFGLSSFQPHMAFTSFSRMDRNSMIFLETKKSTEAHSKYKSRFQGFNLLEPSQKWINETLGDKQRRFKRQTRASRPSPKVPQSVWDIVEDYYVKGVFGVTLNDKQNGSIILIEICSSDDIPCSGTVTYKYCVAGEHETHPADEGGSCHADKLQLLFDCSIDWRTTTVSPPVGGETHPDGSPVTNGTNGDLPPGGEPGSTGGTPKDEESKGGMTWLWILIILIIIIIIIIVIIFCFCCKKKTEKPPKEAAAGAAGAGAGAGAGAAAGPPSGTGKPSASGGGGLEKSSSTMSTASTRSDAGSDSV